MRRHIQYFSYLMQHKRYVFQECRKLGVPLWIALLHDWDKALPSIWLPYARFVYAKDDAERAQAKAGALLAKQRHMQRNKHHWQYWVFIGDEGEIEPLPMPDIYRREMLADWRGAAISLGKPDLLGWYTAHGKKMLFHDETRAWLERELGYKG